MIVKARQNLPFIAHLKVHPAQAVKNAPVLARQNQVGIAAHDLQNQMLLRGAAHFIGAIERHVEQPLHLRLLHGHETASRQVLAQEHAEHGRLRRVFGGFVC